MRKLKHAVVVSLILWPGLVFAQKEEQSLWSTKFASSIVWQRVNSLGYIIVSTGDALHAINPEDGTLLWTNTKFSGINPGMIEEIIGTTFFKIHYTSSESSAYPLQAITNILNGTVIFDSQTEKIGVLSLHVLPVSGRLLVMGVNTVANPPYPIMYMYDLATGKQLWMDDKMFRPEEKKKSFLSQFQGSTDPGIQAITSEPMEMDDQSMILTFTNFIMKMNSVTGQVAWKNPIQPVYSQEQAFSRKAKILVSPYLKDIVIAAVEIESQFGSRAESGAQSEQSNKYFYNQYYAFNATSGSPIWKKPAREEDHLGEVIMLEKGVIICPFSYSKPTLNFIDYASGETIWGNKGKGVKTQGSVVNYLMTEKGILVTSAYASQWNNNGEEFYLNLLDPVMGTLKYEKAVKLKGTLVSSELVPKGLLFVTKREVNIMDVATGALVWPTSIESGGPATGKKVKPFPVGKLDDKLYVYSSQDKGVYEVNKTAGSNRLINITPVVLQGNEWPTAVDVNADGIVLSSSQNLVKIDFNGTIVYNKYFPAPKEQALVRALWTASAIFDLFNSDASVSSTGQTLKLINERLKASKATADFVVMMTKQENGENQLIQVSKSTGMIVRSVNIKNNLEPEYDIDRVRNVLYYRPDDHQIVCYKL